MMTTDNGSNFWNSLENLVSILVPQRSTKNSAMKNMSTWNFFYLNTIVSNLLQPSVLPREVLPICLPPHSKYACHLLNLCCPFDLEKISDPTFNTIIKSVETKVTKLCNAQGFRDNTSDWIRTKPTTKKRVIQIDGHFESWAVPGGWNQVPYWVLRLWKKLWSFWT